MYPIQRNEEIMTCKKIFLSLIFLMISHFAFCANDISLMKKAKEQGMTFYWDSLSETGMLEKNGHQISEEGAVHEG